MEFPNITTILRRHPRTPNGHHWAEDVACHYLIKRGLQLKQRNYRTRGGELDLVMLDREEWVFVEVRQRKNDRFGDAIESVDRRKQRKIILAAEVFMQQHQLTDEVPCRFDILGIDTSRTPQVRTVDDDTDLDITWIQNAFDA